MVDANPDDLHPDLKPLALACLADYASTYPERHPARIIITWRSAEDQQAAYDTGKSNAKPGESKHEFMLDGKRAARAFDYAVYDEMGDYIEDGTDDWYADFAALGKKRGLVWGGDWKERQDWDHLEMAG